MLVSGKQVAVSGEGGGGGGVKTTLETSRGRLTPICWRAQLLSVSTIVRLNMVSHCFIIDDHGQLPWFKMIQQW